MKQVQTGQPLSSKTGQVYLLLTGRPGRRRISHIRNIPNYTRTDSGAG